MKPTLDEMRFMKALEVIEEELGEEKKEELKYEIMNRADEELSEE